MKMISIKRNQLELGCYFFLKDLTPVMKKSQKYLPINFSKGTFLRSQVKTVLARFNWE